MHVKLSYTCCIGENMIMHYLNSWFEFEFEPWVQINPNLSVASGIRPNHIILPCHDHASYCALHWLCFLLCCRYLSPFDRCDTDDEIDDTDEELYYLQKCQASKKPLFIPIQSHSLAPALFYYIRTTMIQLLLVAVVEPLILCMTCHCHSK